MAEKAKARIRAAWRDAMRRFITGVKDGKACMVKVIDHDLGGTEITGADFIDFSVNPPAPRPPGNAGFLDAQLAPGHLKWLTTYFPPNAEFPMMHQTDSIDLHTILSGSIDLILDDGAHRISAGDCVVVAGVDHAWKAGPEGCVSSLVMIGTPPPAAA
jgi:hypothetical protein